jgi:hypothetical protein
MVAAGRRPAAATALDAYVLDDFLLEQCIIPLLRNVPFRMDFSWLLSWWGSWRSNKNEYQHQPPNAALSVALGLALIRCGTLWITRGHLPGAGALGLCVDYRNDRRRLVWYSFLRCAVPVLYQQMLLLIDYSNNNKDTGIATSSTSAGALPLDTNETKLQTSVEQMRALRRRKYVVMWIERIVERTLPTLRWAAWTTAFWWSYVGDNNEQSRRMLISPELEMRLSGLSYRPTNAATSQSSNNHALRDQTPLNCAFGQRRWMWDILVRSAQLHTAGLWDVPQILTALWKHPLVLRLRRTKLRDLQGEYADAARYVCQKCGRSPTNAVQVTFHGQPFYECYLCSRKS